MDPDVALADIRADVAAILTPNNPLDVWDQIDIADKLAERVSALDEFLSKGGFLPKAWQR